MKTHMGMISDREQDMVSNGNMSMEGFVEVGRGRGDSPRMWPKTMPEFAPGWTGHLCPSPDPTFSEVAGGER